MVKPNINVLNTVTLSLRLVRNPSLFLSCWLVQHPSSERFRTSRNDNPTSGNDKKCKNNKCVCINLTRITKDVAATFRLREFKQLLDFKRRLKPAATMVL
jgi:hypothetical protein